MPVHCLRSHRSYPSSSFTLAKVEKIRRLPPPYQTFPRLLAVAKNPL